MFTWWMGAEKAAANARHSVQCTGICKFWGIAAGIFTGSLPTPTVSLENTFKEGIKFCTLIFNV